MKVYRSPEEIPLPDYGDEDTVAIKLHMGERGNPHYVKPGDVAVLVDRIISSGAEAFIGDTTTLYQRKRATVEDYLETAAINGFTEEKVGCPVIIADQEGGRKFGNVEVAEGFLKANSLLVYSHATGHITTGFAGAIKNISMGCVTRDGKRYIHSPAWPRYDREKCAFCGDCIEACPFDFLSMDDGIELTLRNCPACGRCLDACKNGGLYRSDGAMEECYRRYAETCNVMMGLFESVHFVNDLRRITEFCDCSVDPGPIISDDIGLIASGDPVEIDVETVKIITGFSPDAGKFFGKKWRDYIDSVSAHLEEIGGKRQ